MLNIHSNISLHRAWEALSAVHDCLTELARPSDQLFEELINCLDKLKHSFEGLQQNPNTSAKACHRPCDEQQECKLWSRIKYWCLMSLVRYRIQHSGNRDRKDHWVTFAGLITLTQMIEKRIFLPIVFIFCDWTPSSIKEFRTWKNIKIFLPALQCSSTSQNLAKSKWNLLGIVEGPALLHDGRWIQKNWSRISFAEIKKLPHARFRTIWPWWWQE